MLQSSRYNVNEGNHENEDQVNILLFDDELCHLALNMELLLISRWCMLGLLSVKLFIQNY